MGRHTITKEDAVTTLVIDRGTLPESISSHFETPRLRVKIPQGGGKATITPVIDSADHDNETDNLNVIHGMREKILAGINAPDSECERVPDDWINRNVWDDGNV